MNDEQKYAFLMKQNELLLKSLADLELCKPTPSILCKLTLEAERLKEIMDVEVDKLKAKLAEVEKERDAIKAKLEHADTRIRRLETCVEDFLELTEVPDANCSCHLGPPCRDCVEYGRIREVCEWATALLKERGV